jgi:hypothetical protein
LDITGSVYKPFLKESIKCRGRWDFLSSSLALFSPPPSLVLRWCLVRESKRIRKIHTHEVEFSSGAAEDMGTGWI